MLKAALEVADGRVPVLAGIAEYTTELALEAAWQAERVGADGLMVLPARVYEQSAVARATALPVMVYSNSVAYKVDLKPSAFAHLAVIDKIVAIKDSAHDSRRMTDIRVELGDRYLLFCGVDELVLENGIAGAVGWVAGLANAFPVRAVRLFTLARTRQLDEALALYRWFMPLWHLDSEKSSSR